MNIRAPYEETYNYYGDESSHLKNDGNKYMALGALCCPKHLSKQFTDELCQIKVHHGFNKNIEVKCTKVSMGAIDFYKDIIEWFLNCPDLYFRIVLINKEIIRTTDKDDYNLFYYKMYYTLFRYFMHGTTNHIYLDYKDSRSYLRCAEIQEYLSNDHITRMKKNTVQQINSKESSLIQITDLLIGLFCYNANKKNTNEAKLQLVNLLKQRTKLDLTSTTNNASKIDILNWRPKR